MLDFSKGLFMHLLFKVFLSLVTWNVLNYIWNQVLSIGIVDLSIIVHYYWLLRIVLFETFKLKQFSQVCLSAAWDHFLWLRDLTWNDSFDLCDDIVDQVFIVSEFYVINLCDKLLCRNLLLRLFKKWPRIATISNKFFYFIFLGLRLITN
jgi:hypothetical protein